MNRAILHFFCSKKKGFLIIESLVGICILIIVLTTMLSMIHYTSQQYQSFNTKIKTIMSLTSMLETWNYGQTDMNTLPTNIIKKLTIHDLRIVGNELYQEYPFEYYTLGNV